MSPAMNVTAYAARTGLVSQRILNASFLLLPSLWTTVGTHLVNHHLFVQVYLPPRNHLGSRIQKQMLQGARGHSEKQQSARPSGKPLVIEPLNVPAPSERVVLEVVQYGIKPIRLPLPLPDDEILSGYDDMRGKYPIRTQH